MSTIDPNTVLLAAEVGMKALNVFLANRGEKVAEDEAEKREQLRQLSESISTVKGMADFQAVLEASKKKEDKGQPSFTPHELEEGEDMIAAGDIEGEPV